MRKTILLIIWIAFTGLSRMIFAQTVTVTKITSIIKNADRFEEYDDKKHKYSLLCYETKETPCTWSFPPEKIKGHKPEDIEDWVKREISNGKTEGDTLYKNKVYVQWHVQENTTKIKMSDKPIKQR